jgi:hypothetical protein
VPALRNRIARRLYNRSTLDLQSGCCSNGRPMRTLRLTPAVTEIRKLLVSQDLKQTTIAEIQMIATPTSVNPIAADPIS